MGDDSKTTDLNGVIVDVHHFDPSSILVLAYSNEIVIAGSHPELSDDHGFATRSFHRVYHLAEDAALGSVSVVINPARLMLVRALGVNEHLTKGLSIGACAVNYISLENMDLLGDSLMRETAVGLHENVMARLEKALESYDTGLLQEMNLVGTDQIDGRHPIILPSPSRIKKKSCDLEPVGVSIDLNKLDKHKASSLRHSRSSTQQVTEQLIRGFKRKSLKRPFVNEETFPVPSTSKLCEEPELREKDTYPIPSTSKLCEETELREKDTYPIPSTGKSYEKRISDQDTSFERESSAQRSDRKRSTDEQPPPKAAEYKKPREEEEENEDSM